MSILKDSAPYSELALFIEENLTQLVKYKVVTRAKYQQFDQLVSDYSLAEDFGDEERKTLYADQIENLLIDFSNKVIKQFEVDISFKSEPVVIEMVGKLQECLNDAEPLSVVPQKSGAVADDSLEEMTDLMLKMAEDLKGAPLTEEERSVLSQKIADGSLMEAEADYNDVYYHYDRPDYSIMAKPNRLSKPMTYLVPGFETDDCNIDDTYDTIRSVVDGWTRDKLVKNITKLVYLHLSEWKNDDLDVYMYGLRVPLALIEHFRLHECLPLVLEILRQEYDFQNMYFIEDSLEDMQAAVLSNIIEADDLPLLLEFMQQPGILFSSKRQVAMAVGHLPKRDAQLLNPVKQWFSDVLNYYYPLGTDSDMFDEVMLDTLVYCCIHCNVTDLKPLIIKLYSQYHIPYIMVGGGCNEMRQKIKKAPLGTLQEESAEQMLINNTTSWDDDDWDEDDDDLDDWEDAEECDEEDGPADPEFRLEEYGWQEFSPYAIYSKMTFKPVRTVRKYTIRISLNGTKPAVWREVVVPSSLTLTSLASVVLLAMGWDEDHLHQFVAGKGQKTVFYATSLGEIESDMLDGKDGRKFCIGEILAKQGDMVCFEYDYGDSWQHSLKLVSSVDYKADEEKEIILTAGERACPPEDCGGIPGYMDICQAMQNPTTAHAQRLIEWMGCRFDPDLFPLQKAQAYVRGLNSSR